MRRIFRLDISKLDGAVFTAQGFLKVPVKATRTGIFKYKMADGSIINELRPPEEVFDAESMASLENAPITDDHPSEAVTAENVSQYAVGHLGDSIDKDGEFISSKAVIQKKDVIEKVKGGKVEVSCGYDCELDFTPGVWRGQKYDAIQKKIRYNHLAIVDKGRAGPEARLRLDTAEELEQEETNTMEMVKIKIGEAEYDVPKAVAEHLVAMEDGFKKKEAEMAGQMDAMKAEKQCAMDEKSKAEAKADGLAAEIEKAKKATKVDSDTVKLAVKARILAIETAKKILPRDKHEKLDEMEDTEIKKEVVCAHAGNEKACEGKDEIYISARFDAVSDIYKDAAAKNVGEDLSKGRESNPASDVEKARLESQKRDAEAWKQPLSANKH